MQWDDLRYFLAVQRRGSHKAAGRQLRVAPTTVARRIAALEASLNAKLFVRTPERLEQSAAGRALLEHALRVEASVLACERALGGLDASAEGPLCVTAGDAFAKYVLIPALPELRRLHPGLSLELRTDTRALDLSRREADVALRLFRPREPALVARRLGGLRFGLFASADYLERRGTPRTLAALGAHDFIGFGSELDALPQTRWLTRRVESVRYVLRCNDSVGQVAACSAGLGVALLPLFVAPHEPKLRLLFAREPGPEREMWSVVHRDLRTNPRVLAFLSFLGELFGRGAELAD